MKYTQNTKPGMGDPYWYEYSVGVKYIVDMLNPDNHIKYVELQANVPLGLDDVVVTFEDGHKRFIQVKHTRTNGTLTFGDLVMQASSNVKSGSKKISLLGELAKSWFESKNNYPVSEVYLFTNRTVGKRSSMAGSARSIKRPPLDSFWKELQKKVSKVEKFSEIQFSECVEAWDEWCQQLDCIDNDRDKLCFLRSLHIETDRESLEELGEEIKVSLRELFSCSEQASEILLGKFDHALRKWTTSLRKSSRIEIEDVYAELSLNEETVSYNQDLIPADPFFSSRINLVNNLENELVNGNSKVIFLSGAPGAGKTNIISKLCCRKESRVDIRYYAYEPIQPGKEYLTADVSRRVSAEVFWGTLLNQLRDLLSGKLFKYRIPVLNSFLSIEEIRTEFFRIASEYAYDEQRTFVVAIDGLDHAARAGCVEDTFLPSLPYPEYIPDNIKILIAGQPKEDYQKYPNWLKQESDDVKEYIVPAIQPTDVQDLVEDKCKSMNPNQRRLITDVVCKYAEGNTLSAIFAVHEAMFSENPVDFERKLQKRRLSGNIQEYYRTIWEEVKGKIGFAFVDYKMAGVFSFFNEPVSAEKLIQIFPEESINKSNWKNILKALKPLLIEQNGYYTILHNDVRVYLSSIIGLDQEHVQEVYSNLANYYISQSIKTEGYYRDAIRFLIAADRGNEFEKIYSPKYVISAYVNGIELNELRVITDDLLKMVISSVNINWNKLRNLTMGYMTIDQIEKSTYEIENPSFRQNKGIITIHPYECFVEPEIKWNETLISDVLKLVCTLYENGEIIRGRTLFHNWFNDMDFPKLEVLVANEDDGVHFNSSKSVAELIGRASTYVGEYNLLSGVMTETGSISTFASEAIERVLQEIFNILDPELFLTAIESVEVLFSEPIILGIKKLIDSNRFEQLQRLELALGKRHFSNKVAKMLFAFLQIINGTVSWTDAEAQELWEQIQQVEIPDEYIENLMSYYTIYAIVSAYLQDKSRSAVAREVTERYLSGHKYKKKQYFLLYFNCVCFLGKWIKARNMNSCLYESLSDLTNILENLYHKSWPPNDTDFETYYLRAYILKAFILLAKGENKDFQSEFEKELERLFADNPANQLLDPGLMFYSDNPSRMQKWVDYWLAENGKVWSEALGERNRIIKQFIASVNRYDKSGTINLRGAEEKAKWSVIGFASHKEYTVDTLLNWYNALVEFNINNIVTYGRLVKDVSDTIEMIGDNRIEYTLNSKIYSDWGSLGTKYIQDILEEQRYLSQCIVYPEYLVQILIGYLKYAELSRKQLLTIWGLGIGLLDWKNEDNHATICALQRAIEVRALEMDILDIRVDLLKIGPAYIDLTVDPMKYVIPYRWCDSVDSKVEVKNAVDIVESYLENSTDIGNKGEVLRSIKSLHLLGQLNHDLSAKIISHELQSQDYSIYQNSILEFIIPFADKQYTEKAIVDYLSEHLDSKHFYPSQDLPAIITWWIKSEGEDYCCKSVDELLATYHCWITAADHIKEPEYQEGYDYNERLGPLSPDIVEMYMKILLLIIRSEDADAARSALGGIFAVIRNDISYISVVEAGWEDLHYRAKEWILMLYELCLSLYPEVMREFDEILSRHSYDNDFNVALYAKILHDLFCRDKEKKFEIVKKSFFMQIPDYGNKRFIKLNKKTPWISGYSCVLKQIQLLEKRLSMSLNDLELRSAEYEKSIDAIPDLISLHRFKSGGYKVSCDNVNQSFFRVLYNDWYKGRWEGRETDLARCILSASEPYYLIVSPQRWKWNGGKLFDEVGDLLERSDDEKKDCIKEILNEGLKPDEMVIAGSIVDYTYKKEIFGFLLSYIDEPFYTSELAINRAEHNSRLILLKRDDFTEKKHLNVTLHHNGIESFKDSNIKCGISKFALSTFGWSVEIGDAGAKLINRVGKVIGSLEIYYGIRTDVGIRNSGNQPLLQRWVVKKIEISKALKDAGCPFKLQTVIDFYINNSNAG